MPSAAFKLLLVEGGDEEAVCRWLTGKSLWTSFGCWVASSDSRLPAVAAAAALAPNFAFAESRAVILDAEGDLSRALDIADRTLTAMGGASPGHGKVAGGPKSGLFVSPDGVSLGSLETLCRAAATDVAAAKCTDAYEACVKPLTLRAQQDKRWVAAYIAAVLGPRKYIADAIDAGLFDRAPFSALQAFLAAL
jgi:hypothetical protein